jgi:NAD(P)-dependent dehydrogenase (short-subunit alcohol dehydrogenase family)
MTTSSGRPIVLVTGAASGIGSATAEAFANQGWTVYATDIESTFPPAVETACRCLELDVTDREQCQAVVDHVLDETGRIDVLVNNAGFAVPGPVEDVPVEASRQQFDVMVHGTHSMTQAVLPAMRDRGTGRIVMLSSVLGVAPTTGLGTYGAAKAAVESLSDSLRMELAGTGISVTLVEPAWVDTEFSGTASERLPTTERTPAYSEIYEAITDGWVVDGGPLAVSPETVASTVIEAATGDPPSDRYPVGRLGRLIAASRRPLLPTSLLDRTTRQFNRTSVTARKLWAFVSGSGDSGDASTVRLSTGHEVSVPLSTEASISGAVLSASAQGVDSLLPDSLEPVRITPNRSAITLLSVDYSRIGAGEIDPYNEVAIMIPAVPETASSRIPLLSALSGDIGGYVWQLPVTTEPACALGREIWGYPKSIAEIDISTDDRVTQTRLTVDGQRVLSLAVERLPTRSRELSLSSYTLLDDTLCKVEHTLAGRLRGRPLSSRVDWAFGDHPWGHTLAALEIGPRPLARFGGNCEFTIGIPQRLDMS